MTSVLGDQEMEEDNLKVVVREEAEKEKRTQEGGRGIESPAYFGLYSRSCLLDQPKQNRYWEGSGV